MDNVTKQEKGNYYDSQKEQNKYRAKDRQHLLLLSLLRGNGFSNTTRVLCIDIEMNPAQIIDSSNLNMHLTKYSYICAANQAELMHAACTHSGFSI